MICSISDCDNPILTKKSGLCRRHYLRQWKYGDPNSCKIPGVDYNVAGDPDSPNLKHGYWRHFGYKIHNHMMGRCYNENVERFPEYGGRGISVCDEWHDVVIFCDYLDEHLGPKPVGSQIDRIDNDGNYEPGNIRWLTRQGQARNKSTTKLSMNKASVIRATAGLISRKEQAELYGVSIATIKKVRSGAYWS